MGSVRCATCAVNQENHVAVNMNELILEIKKYNMALKSLEAQLDRMIDNRKQVRDNLATALMNLAADDGAIVPDESVFYLDTKYEM